MSVWWDNRAHSLEDWSLSRDPPSILESVHEVVVLPLRIHARGSPLAQVTQEQLRRTEKEIFPSTHPHHLPSSRLPILPSNIFFHRHLCTSFSTTKFVVTILWFRLPNRPQVRQRNALKQQHTPYLLTQDCLHYPHCNIYEVAQVSFTETFVPSPRSYVSTLELPSVDQPEHWERWARTSLYNCCF